MRLRLKGHKDIIFDYPIWLKEDLLRHGVKKEQLNLNILYNIKEIEYIENKIFKPQIIKWLTEYIGIENIDNKKYILFFKCEDKIYNLEQINFLPNKLLKILANEINKI